MLREGEEKKDVNGRGQWSGKGRDQPPKLPFTLLPQPFSQPCRGTYLIPGTSQDRGREDEDS